MSGFETLVCGVGGAAAGYIGGRTVSEVVMDNVQIGEDLENSRIAHAYLDIPCPKGMGGALIGGAMGVHLASH